MARAAADRRPPARVDGGDGDGERELEHRRHSLQITGEDDDETLLNLLRRAHHAELFRTLARDVEGVLTVEEVADELSALADTTLRITARWCWERLKQAHRETPRFAILGYGKLGGKELGYGSDLDIVFVYEDEDERAPEIYAAYVRKIINWLSTKTAEGDLFEIDTALRPNGSSGLLVTTFRAYDDYQQRRGSNTAWTWEHQALTRARFVAGDPKLAADLATKGRDNTTDIWGLVWKPRNFEKDVFDGPMLLSTALAQSKNTVAVGAGNRVVLSPHIGDLGGSATFGVFRKTVGMLGALSLMYSPRSAQLASCSARKHTSPSCTSVIGNEPSGVMTKTLLRSSALPAAGPEMRIGVLPVTV